MWHGTQSQVIFKFIFTVVEKISDLIYEANILFTSNQIKLKQTKKHSAWSGITSRGSFQIPQSERNQFYFYVWL